MLQHNLHQKKLVLVTVDTLAKDSLSSELSTLFNELGENVTLESRTINKLGPRPTVDLCLVSSPVIVQRIQDSWGTLDCPFLVCRRSIEHHQIKKILEIPRRTEVLLVIGFEQDAVSLQQLLEGAGITHLKYIPWSPGNPVPEHVRYAVTPGKPHLVPSIVPNIIDIGTRTIDITTIMEMMQKLKVLDYSANKISTRLIKELVELYREVLQESINVRTDRAILEEMLNQVIEGIAVLNSFGQVERYNKKFLDLAKIITENKSEQHLFDPDEDNFLKWFGISTGIRSQLFKGEQYQVLVSLTPLGSEQSKYLVFLRDVTEITKLHREVFERLATQGHIAKHTINDIVSVSERMKEAKDLAFKFARSNGTVLLIGESGVGKELFAQAIHNASERSHLPFVAINFSSLSESLMESELFGYEEGAFTGAKKGGKIGLLELANGGTIFLDEIGDASPAIQLRLLRALQERQIIRVGGTKIHNLDIRVIAATHRDLEKEVQCGRFRQDLYYRLAVFQLEIPALRERKEDIFPLFKKFLMDAREYRLDRKLEYLLSNYPWYGNVRELENCALYVKGIADREVGFQHLPPNVRRALSNLMVDEAIGAMSLEPMQKDPPLKEQVRNESSDKDLIDTTPIYREILIRIKEHQEASGMGIGRRNLASKITNCMVTGEKLRSRLKILQSLGMVDVAKGRRGTTITKRGIEYLGGGDD